MSDWVSDGGREEKRIETDRGEDGRTDHWMVCLAARPVCDLDGKME